MAGVVKVGEGRIMAQSWAIGSFAASLRKIDEGVWLQDLDQKGERR
ncbi:MAG: hypothetical protein AAF603_06370 [Pseudomonadota bacterium]